MRIVIMLLLFAGCQKDVAKPIVSFRASCKPDANHDRLECSVENIGNRPRRACVTAREQVPKSRPLIAQRVCTKVLAPGEKHEFVPKFDHTPSLQPLCAPEGQWVCRDEIVETPEMLDQNIPGQN
jgi:hypothetical protein